MTVNGSAASWFFEIWLHHWNRLCSWISSYLSLRAEHNRLECLLNSAASYDEWYTAASMLDKADANDIWAHKVESKLYDYRLILERTQALRLARLPDVDLASLEFLFRTSLLRNLGGILNPSLYAYTRAGTKFLISEFLQELVISLETICSENVMPKKSTRRSSRSKIQHSTNAESNSWFKIQSQKKQLNSEIPNTPITVEPLFTFNSASPTLNEPAVKIDLKKIDQQRGYDAFNAPEKNEVDSSVYRTRVQQVLNFLHGARQSHGRTALLLSGGGALAMYHAGVIKCLWENNLLPRIISGASGGSVVASFVGTHTEQEFHSLFALLLSGDLRLFDDDIDEQMVPKKPCVKCRDEIIKKRKLQNQYKNQNKFFRRFRQNDRYTDSGSEFEDASDSQRNSQQQQQQHCNQTKSCTHSMQSRNSCLYAMRNVWIRLTRFFKNGEFMNLDTLRDTLRSMFGDITFLEAYNRTRRIINITVSAADVYEMPTMLNFVTAPEVVVWSAVLASCAIPIIVKPMPLMAKARDGSLHVWAADNQNWVDGSIDSDLPIRELTVQFGVNHFIVSQVNPHVAPLLNRHVSRPLWRRAADAVLGFAAEELDLRLQQLEDLGALPHILRQMRSIIFQKYRGDITIVPEISGESLLRVLRNPTSQGALDALRVGVEATLPKIALIKNSLLVEAAIDRLVYGIRMLELDLKSQSKNKRLAKMH